MPHHRDVIKEPLQPNECTCSRQDCTRRSCAAASSADGRKRSGDPLACGTRHLPIRKKTYSRTSTCGVGTFLTASSCGSKVDAVYRVLTYEGLHVLTNGINGRLTADRADIGGKEYEQGDYHPHWIVTSPPYKHAFAILKQALVVARVDVIFKLRLSTGQECQGCSYATPRRWRLSSRCVVVNL